MKSTRGSQPMANVRNAKPLLNNFVRAFESMQFALEKQYTKAFFFFIPTFILPQPCVL
jgi:hypothetical protein